APTRAAARGALSLHDALPIWRGRGEASGLHQAHASSGEDDVAVLAQAAAGFGGRAHGGPVAHGDVEAAQALAAAAEARGRLGEEDRKSTRLNSSHVAISYAVF